MDSKIRLLFKQVYTDKNKKPLYPELINEIIEETIGSNKEQLRQNLLAKLKIENKKKDVKKKPKINPHDILMDSVHSLASISAQIAQVVEKFNENSDVFLNSKMTGFQKFKKRLRRAMGLKDKPVSYKITITDATTNTKHHETVQFSEFIVSLEKKARNYAILSQLDSSGHKKFEAKNDTEILDFVIKQLCDWQKISQTISGLDDFFKTQTPNSEKAKIKGIKVEIMAIKNAIIKANQKKTDYISIIEEQQQMEKLGITDED